MPAKTSEDNSSNSDGNLPYRGVHHLVLNTDDIKKTIDFYWGVMGFPLIHGMKVPSGLGGSLNRGNPPYENIRHYFFDMGSDSMLAFFELPKGVKEEVDRDGIAAMQHVAFSLPPSRVDELVSRIDAAGIERIGPMNSAPGCYSMYIYDPNGIRLEICYQPAHGDNQQIIDHFLQTPDQLLAELRTVYDDDDWLEWVAKPLREQARNPSKEAELVP